MKASGEVYVWIHVSLTFALEENGGSALFSVYMELRLNGLYTESVGNTICPVYFITLKEA